ncbi:MAG: hypothetical protein H7Y18_19270 [Clostridiaceae bacterium]|nr:hypothetical protein [Clostridiaceae bacterium]
MARSRKSCGCGSKDSGCNSGCNSDFSRDNNFVDPINTSRRQSRRGRFLFPTDIRSLLILIAEEDDDDNRASLVLDACTNHCFIEDARIIAVTDNTVIIKDGNGCDSKFRYVCIGCICEVIVDCEVILEELFEEHSLNRE